MNYEEKYNEILEWARKNKARLNGVPIEEVLPELRESEEKKMTREEAIEIIRKNMPSDKSLPVYEALRSLIPELSESENEDESTRKALIETVKCIYAGDTMFLSEQQRDRYLAYLEKQAEEKFDLIDRNFRRGREVGYREGVADTIAKQKEQKPAESISQLTVQGKGVYKICPRCKERMVRDDSMVYTSMPPQYRYECPKCGESECDTVMYDNPEMEEQKPNSTEDMPYITDEHFYEREPADSFKYKLAEYMTRCCTKKEGPYGYEYGISAESILKMAEEELLKRGVVQKPAENGVDVIKTSALLAADRLASAEMTGRLKERSEILDNPTKYGLQKPAEWSEEDKRAIDRACVALRAYANGDLPEFLPSELIGYADRLQSLRPSWKPSEVCYGVKGDPDPAGVWKPSEEQLKALHRCIYYLRSDDSEYFEPIKSLYEQLKKL